MEISRNAEDRQKVWALIKDIKVTMMTTHDDEGDLFACPMAAVQDKFEGELWFFTRNDSRKIEDIQGNPKVLLAYSNPAKQEYVSVAGTAETISDRAKIREMWSEGLRVWFPKGAEDPSIVLIKVVVSSAEYWDSPSFAMVRVYGYVKAMVTGTPPVAGENKRVLF